MSDDIVTRLRERGEWDAHPMGGREWFPDELCEEAADEIELLREDRNRWRDLAVKLLEVNSRILDNE